MSFSDITGYKWTVNYYDGNITAIVNHNMKIKDHNRLVKAGDAIRKIYSPTKFQDKIGTLVRVSYNIATFIRICQFIIYSLLSI